MMSTTQFNLVDFLTSAWSKKMEAASPRGLAAFRSFSALAYFAADTIFIDIVIFWMFVTDFSRMAISFKLGILAGL